MKKILILHDYKGMLACKFIGSKEEHYDSVLNLEAIKEELVSKGFEVTISEFATLDMSKNYAGYYVLYPSSEEKGLFYKNYISDVVLRLMSDGAVLLPSFQHFQCHHNKSFAEMYRAGLMDEKLKTPKSLCIGRYEELELVKGELTYPVVVKTASGSGSVGVKLAKSADELEAVVKKLMRHTYRNQEYTWLREFGHKPVGFALKKLMKKLKGDKKLAPRDEPYYSNKIVLQDMIPNLSGDYKVLYFHGKYYCLGRKNRDNDFRASGSGKFAFPETVEEIRNVLELARCAVKEFNEPMISMDIAENDEGCYLIEFQFLYFGPYTLQYSDWYFTYDEDSKMFIKVNEKSDLEKEYARAVAEYIDAM